MFAVSPSPVMYSGRQRAAAAAAVALTEARFSEGGLVRLLAAGDSLIKAGDAKSHIYRVASGLLHTVAPGGGPSLTYAREGSVVGLGGLDRHEVTVMAVADTVVQCLPRSAMAALAIEDPRVADQHAEQTALELALMRERVAQQGRSDALVRVASLLSVLAAHNGYEGRDAAIIGDDITCALVTEQLGLDVPALEESLITLADMGLVRPRADGALQIMDPAGLDRVAGHA